VAAFEQVGSHRAAHISQSEKSNSHRQLLEFRYFKAKPAWSRLRTADQNSGRKYEKAIDAPPCSEPLTSGGDTYLGTATESHAHIRSEEACDEAQEVGDTPLLSAAFQVVVDPLPHWRLSWCRLRIGVG
jgi:hypothetical protein